MHDGKENFRQLKHAIHNKAVYSKEVRRIQEKWGILLMTVCVCKKSILIYNSITSGKVVEREYPSTTAAVVALLKQFQFSFL